jgi:hypothetical protein
MTAPLGSLGTCSATYVASAPGQTTDLIFDVTGYFVPDTTGTAYVTLTPPGCSTRGSRTASGPLRLRDCPDIPGHRAGWRRPTVR